MMQAGKLTAMLALGTAGGLLFSRLRLPGGVILGAMLAVVAYRFLDVRAPALPEWLSLAMQILVGVTVGAMFQPEMLSQLRSMLLPVLLSCAWLMAAGAAFALARAKSGGVGPGPAYLGTGPGAMTVMIGVAADSGGDAPLVLTFHFVRIVIVIGASPLILWALGKLGG